MNAECGLRNAESGLEGRAPSRPAIDIAREIYRKNGLDFDEDRDAFDRDGYVLALPHVFIMARAVELPDGRKAWWVQCAVGRLKTLLNFMPAQLPFIAFCRPQSGANRMRVYPLPKFHTKSTKVTTLCSFVPVVRDPKPA